VAAAIARFAAAPTFPVRRRGRSEERSVDARALVARLEAVGPRRLVVEVVSSPAGGLRPSALVAELLALSPEVQPLLGVRKLATRFRTAPADEAAATA
jgi:hypothetical protein